jgi:hypothetical protein
MLRASYPPAFFFDPDAFPAEASALAVPVLVPGFFPEVFAFAVFGAFAVFDAFSVFGLALAFAFTA